jgi:hypothetical protein
LQFEYQFSKFDANISGDIRPIVFLCATALRRG